MMKLVLYLRRFLFVVVVLSSAAFANADPSNFMVGPFTFVRPEHWVWKEVPDSSHASALMFIGGADSNKENESQVLISFTQATREQAAARWKSYFPEILPAKYSLDSKKVKSHLLTYVNAEGTYHTKGKDKPEHVLLGAIIETPKGNVCGRLIGPKDAVARLGPQFKKMIEDALKEE